MQTLYAQRRAPISFEWTIPYGRGYFHLGVHNLPATSATAWFSRLAALTAQPQAAGVAAALDELDAIPEVLVVFNHPMWDLAGVGADEHNHQMQRFLDEYGRWLHALELNGYRSKRENARVGPIAEHTGLPLISGGDRHGHEPNALLNVTAARSFAEFAAEVRDGVSQVIVMPQYHQHLATRQLSAASDALRSYRRYPPGRQHWTDRITWDTGGSQRPLSFHWPGGGPLWVRSTVGVFQLLAHPIVLPLVRAALQAADGLAAPGSLPTEFTARPPVRAIAGDVN